jgi:hypothetical protein
VHDFNPLLPRRKGNNPLEVLPCRPAAVIPQPPEYGNITPKPEGHFRPLPEPQLDIIALRVVKPDGDTQRQDLRPIHTAPPVKVGRKGKLFLLRPHVDVHLITGESQDLRQPAAVSKGIEIVSDPRPDPKFFPEISSSLGDLADERFQPRQVEIGLEIPASADRPASFPDQAPDLDEKHRVVPLDPAVERRLVVVEDEFIVLPEQRRGVPESGQRLSGALLPTPLPDRIKVGIADEMKPRAGHH